MSVSPTLDLLVRDLSRPEAFPYTVDEVEIEQTHISVVFLAGDFVYKVKKPLDLGFLDFTTLEKRRHFCLKEVELNRPRAPGVYLDVVPVVETTKGFVFEGSGPAVEYAVKMERLPPDASLRHLLRRQELEESLIRRVARRIASLHGEAAGGPEAARFGRYEVVSFNAIENFDQSEPQVDLTVSSRVFSRFRRLTEDRLLALRATIEGRAETGVPRDTHGDLHLDHIYVFPDRAPPRDLLIVDCIEFNDRLRFADPMADFGFLAMDLLFEGRKDLSEALTEAYFTATPDPEGELILPFYIAYRAAVRGKVEGMCYLQESIPTEVREKERVRSVAHWLLGLGALEEPSLRPCAILTAGLPGTGKSTLANVLGDHANFEAVSSDEVRKELAGITPLTSARAEFEAGLYSTEWTERTYSACLERTLDRLFDGARVVVDATFRDEEQRLLFLDRVRAMGIPLLFMHCQADSGVVKTWIEERPDDPSDAYWGVYERMAEEWEAFGPDTGRLVRPINTEGPGQQLLARALQLLEEEGLWASD